MAKIRMLIDFMEWSQGDIVALNDRDAQQLVSVGMAESIDL